MTNQPPSLLGSSERASSRGSKGRRWLAVGAGLVLAGLALLHVFSPETSGFYPRCGLYVLTGLHCPGCGSLRALHHLTHGRLEAAVDSNALLILGLAGGLAWSLVCWIGRKPILPRVGRAAPRILLGLLILSAVFGLLRNLPWYPFAVLAP